MNSLIILTQKNDIASARAINLVDLREILYLYTWQVIHCMWCIAKMQFLIHILGQTVIQFLKLVLSCQIKNNMSFSYYNIAISMHF